MVTAAARRRSPPGAVARFRPPSTSTVRYISLSGPIPPTRRRILSLSLSSSLSLSLSLSFFLALSLSLSLSLSRRHAGASPTARGQRRAQLATSPTRSLNSESSRLRPPRSARWPRSVSAATPPPLASFTPTWPRPSWPVEAPPHSPSLAPLASAAQAEGGSPPPSTPTAPLELRLAASPPLRLAGWPAAPSQPTRRRGARGCLRVQEESHSGATGRSRWLAVPSRRGGGGLPARRRGGARPDMPDSDVTRPGRLGPG